MVCAFGWLIYWVREIKERRRADDATYKLLDTIVEARRKKSGKMKEPNIWDEYLAEQERKRETMLNGGGKKHGKASHKDYW